MFELTLCISKFTACLVCMFVSKPQGKSSASPHGLRLPAAVHEKGFDRATRFSEEGGDHFNVRVFPLHDKLESGHVSAITVRCFGFSFGQWIPAAPSKPSAPRSVASNAAEAKAAALSVRRRSLRIEPSAGARAARWRDCRSALTCLTLLEWRRGTGLQEGRTHEL